MSQPLVTVVMPVFNAGKHLAEAVGSIAAQTFCDWKLVCINDGSTDGSARFLDWAATIDERIEVVHQQNAGIVDALNRGCRMAKSKYILRMDADDIALPNRMETQVAFMEGHPECDVVGGGILEVDSDGDPLGYSLLPQSHDDIVQSLMSRQTGHFHPTTLIRRTSLEVVGGYREKYQWIEDHDLWLRMSRLGKLANMSEIVLCYRQHASSVCWRRSAQQRQLMNSLLAEVYTQAGRSMPPGLQLESGQQRSAAGPGKWARAAARNGFPKSALKHLLQLNRSDRPLGYKMRMNAETGLRVLLALSRRLRNRKEHVEVPEFPEWNLAWERLHADGQSSDSEARSVAA